MLIKVICDYIDELKNIEKNGDEKGSQKAKILLSSEGTTEKFNEIKYFVDNYWRNRPYIK
jgi:hypothetical protein